MSGRIYRTASGQEIDMQKLLLKNEEVRAVGNMGINARGDVISNENKSIVKRNAQVNKNYRKQIGNVPQDSPVFTSKRAAETKMQEPVKEAKPKKPKKKKVEVPAGGLASAIAKAREVKQEPELSPQEKERKSDGVKKI